MSRTHFTRTGVAAAVVGAHRNRQPGNRQHNGWRRIGGAHVRRSVHQQDGAPGYYVWKATARRPITTT